MNLSRDPRAVFAGSMDNSPESRLSKSEARLSELEKSALGGGAVGAAMPGSATWLFVESRNSDGTNAWSDKDTGALFHLSRVWGKQAAAANDGDSYPLPAKPLAAGTYKLTLYGYRGTGRGIVDLVVDGAALVSIDMYGTASEDAVWTSTEFTIGFSGAHTFELLVNGKNASSADYSVMLSMVNVYMV